MGFGRRNAFGSMEGGDLTVQNPGGFRKSLIRKWGVKHLALRGSIRKKKVRRYGCARTKTASRCAQGALKKKKSEKRVES